MGELSLPEGTDIDANLRKIWGDEMMDEYNLNSFKIACTESEVYLGLKQILDLLHYQIQFCH